MSGDGLQPAYHFTPARNWMNDPIGLVWYDGEYHLFFQHNPKGLEWGNMSWGHAVSTDLAHWEELPVALRASDAEHVFSGSVVHDRDNTSGLGREDCAPLVAVYTSHDPVTHRESQALAFSLDRGRTWEKYAGNPVLDLDSTGFRDPKVFWHEESGQWVMAVVLADERVVRLYASADLRGWDALSDFGPAGSTDGVWECPDLFPLALDGDPADVRWVLVVSVQSGAPAGGSGVQYFVGDFDGLKFTAEHDDVTWLDHGADYYAAVGFADAPDGRSVHIGWMSNWTYAGEVPAGSSRGAMTLPRCYTLRTIRGRARLCQQPVRDLDSAPVFSARDVELTGTWSLPATTYGTALRVRVTIDPRQATAVGVRLRVGPGQHTVVCHRVSESELWLDRTDSGRADFHPAFAAVHRAPYDPENGLVRLDVYVDATSVEVFAGHGEVVLTDQIFPDPDSTALAVFAEGGSARVDSLLVSRLGRQERQQPPVDRAH